MNHTHQNLSNNDVERSVSKSNGVVNAHRAIADVDNGITMVDVSPQSAVPPRPTVATLPTQEFGRGPNFPDPNRVHCPPPVVGQTPSTHQTSDRVSIVTAQLQANRAAAAQLQSENQQIKTEIYKTIHEITDTSFILGKKAPSPEWCWILSSGVETQILQSNYDELWNIHLNSCEITADLYAKMAQRHGNLWRLYNQTLKSHAVLQDDLQRLTRQLTNPLSFYAAPFFVYLEDNEMPIVGSQTIFDAFRLGQRVPAQFVQAPQPTSDGGPSHATPPVVLANHFAGHPNKRRLEQQAPSTGGVSRLNGYPGLSKRRKVDDA